MRLSDGSDHLMLLPKGTYVYDLTSEGDGKLHNIRLPQFQLGNLSEIVTYHRNSFSDNSVESTLFFVLLASWVGMPQK